MKTIWPMVVTLAACACGGGSSIACKNRAAELRNGVEIIKQKARDQLKIGTARAEVARFYAENNIPLTFDQFGATGTIHTKGCSPRGCGSNDAIIGVRVNLDQNGKVKSEPVVMSMYTDCL